MYIKNGKKILGLSLSAAIAVSAFAGIGFASFDNKAYAAPDKDYGLTAVNEGVILHCFDWKLSDIKAEPVIPFFKASLTFCGLLGILQEQFHILADDRIPDYLLALEVDINRGFADPGIEGYFIH